MDTEIKFMENIIKRSREPYIIKIGILASPGFEDLIIKKFEKPNEVKFHTPFGVPSDVLIEGTINNIPCVLLTRNNRHRFIRPERVNCRANIWALQYVGVTHILSVFACCSLIEQMQPGDFFIPDDFIDMTGTVSTFYRYPRRDCHIMMKPAFSDLLIRLLTNSAEELNIDIHKGGLVMGIRDTICYTDKESSMYRIMKAHVVAQNLVQEAILSKEAGLFYAPFTVIVSYDSCFESRSIDIDHVVEKYTNNLKLIEKIFLKTIDKIINANWKYSIYKFKKMLALSRPKYVKTIKHNTIFTRQLPQGN